MVLRLTRRQFIAGSALLGAALATPGAQAQTRPRFLKIDTRTLVVNGKAARVFSLTDSSRHSGLKFDPGERFTVALENRLTEPSIIHWHGMTPRPEDDGVYDTGYGAPLAPGETRKYDFPTRPGTHWMHSHHGLQEQALLAAPLIVRTAEDLAEDAQEVVVLLHDFTFRDPAEILAGLTGAPASGGGMNHGAMNHGAMSHGTGGGMDLNDVEFDAYLANDRTLDDPEVVPVERNGRVRLRIINGASATAFWIDLGGTLASAIAVDGNPVTPLVGSRFPLAQGQRIDLMLTVPAGGIVPVFARREGDTIRTGLVLAAPGALVPKLPERTPAQEVPVDLSLETQLRAPTPLPARAADMVQEVMLMGSMAPYAWTMDGQTWDTRNRLTVKAGQRVELTFWNHSMMAHPMHLHGHHFQVVGIGDARFSGAIRDTVLVPPMARVTIAFDADNPGRWLYHCHNLYHMAAGMMSEIVYA
ncbi:multicopper oxidase family protein [Elstera cyanobacteriorum]|uniref:multicopper oxidase family protein n=1 Tax=Elstera cyanobacteriorum TaxID=2022747 RepID=UPI002353864E|nr:multicopper oxidase family protein [Elstera cyanobacteriorum]MCK6444593.1 multicopper oxidase family protein [Elstera cyanobacteriorum]